MSTESVFTILSSTATLVVSIIVLVYTARIYLLKSGANIRASFGICTSSIYTEDQYVSNLVIENIKDKSTVIFGIYLKVGYNYYILLEDFENKPLILKPFETFTRTYDPVDFYSVNMRKININDIFLDRRARKTIVLSTSEGKYVVRTWIKIWNPSYDFFRNHLMFVIYPFRAKFRGNSYGSNVKYIVDIKQAGKDNAAIPIYPGDYRVRKFKKFLLTKESLENKSQLESFLRSKVADGSITCDEILVYDAEEWRNELYGTDYSESIRASYIGWFHYKILGVIGTKIREFNLSRENRRIRQSNSS